MERMDGFRLFHFPSVSRIVEYALGDAPCSHPLNEERLRDFWERHEGSARYWNGHTVESVLAELRCPSRARLEAVYELREKIRLSLPPRPSVSRRVRVGMPDGEELDPMAWIGRDPDGWAGLVRAERPSSSRLVRIAVNLAASCEKSQEEFLHRGAAIAALADLLTSRGRSVEVVAFTAAVDSWRRGGEYAERIVVKRSGDPLDLPMLSLCLAEIAFFRVVCLSAMIKFAKSMCHYGLGIPRSTPKSLTRDFDAVAEFTILNKAAAVAFVSGEMDRHCPNTKGGLGVRNDE